MEITKTLRGPVFITPNSPSSGLVELRIGEKAGHGGTRRAPLTPKQARTLAYALLSAAEATESS